MTVRLSNKKDVATTRVRGVNIELDCMTLASILKIPENFGLSDYVKDVWEEANTTIWKKRSDQLHGFSIYGVSDRQASNQSPSIDVRHMAYVISVPHHELPYRELITRILNTFDVPLDDKEGEEPKRYDFFKETFLTMSQSQRENGVWWLDLGANRRRDDYEAPAENVENVEMDEEEAAQQDFYRVQVEEEVEFQGEEQTEKEAEKGENSGFGEKFFDALSDEGPVEAPDVVVPTAPEVSVVLTTPTVQQTTKRTSTGVNPSGPSGSMLDFDLIHLQDEFAGALQRNTRFQELYQQMKSKPPTSPKP
ncbi:hypothetical protein Dimus_037246 [Dionaea muscipula]